MKKINNGEEVYWKNDWFSFFPVYQNPSIRFDIDEDEEYKYTLSFCLFWGHFFFKFKKRKNRNWKEKAYGMYLWPLRGIPDSLYINNGEKIKSYELPWFYDWYSTSCLLKDKKTWETESKGHYKDFWDFKWKDKIYTETVPYTYILKSGKVQNVEATIRVEKREWRQKWLRWTTLFNEVRTTIDVEFSDEIGEKSGTWKGGVMGCSYDLKKGETPIECLRRMEKERKF